MRRSIKAASNDIMKRVTTRFEELLDDRLYIEGYEVKCQGVLPDVKVTVTCRSDEPDRMPVITLDVNEFESNMFEVIPTMTFPKLTVEEQDFADTIHHWLGKWEKVGRAITEVNKFEFDLEAYIEDEEDE